ncbi:MAG TPA: ribosome silencing factor [Bacteroidota bacterium]|nr:ribosome silencing factor [Bacteroidota bacterium]
MNSPALARAVARLALSKKAGDVVTMDLRGLTSMADFFVVCSADSDVQIRAIADAVDEGMLAKGTAPWHRESGSSSWVLLDFVDVVVHIFHRNTRAFYNLEKLWGDAKITRITDAAPGRAPARRTARAPLAKQKSRTNARA